MRRKACIVFFLWGATSMIYYGVSLNSYNLSTNLYIYTFLCGLLEIPAYLLNWPASTTLGRKKTLVWLYLTCSVSISVLTALIMLLEEGRPVLEQVRRQVSVRVAGMAVAAGHARQRRQGEVLVWGPSAVFSLASLAAAFIVTLLPETKNKIMAQGIDDQPEHVMEQHVPSRPQHDPPRTQYDPLRTQYDPLRTHYETSTIPAQPKPKDHEAISQVLVL
ncbi:hypothetical protein Pcinc_039835 [Petrolisthes cinctipes]|uniref:Uncharacterized protein n=1 Tax=Petrolisthes cinctipes TaxID=88211 RepID=A0AAE1EIR0_PETCI|nr:hypothetical protein Pcinc_039835 [Petrolisthes cinctipes]